MRDDIASGVATASTAVPAGPDPRRWKALALLCVANFMVILDSQITILAVPSIGADLHMPAAGVQWVLSAYLLAFGGLLLLGGRASDLLGRRRMFMVGTALFLVSSLGCGLAWAGGALVAARVVQGMSAAIMVPTALSILMTMFDDGAERNRALAVWSAIGGFGATAALLIGGTVTGALGWEWIFFLNVPVAVALLALAPLLLRESRAGDRARSFDPIGAVTVTLALVLLVYAVVEAPGAGWTSVRTVGLFAGGVLLLAAFAAVESRAAAPLLPLRLLMRRSLIGGNAVMTLMMMMAFGMSLVISEYAQRVLGSSPLEFGLGTAIMPVMSIVGSYAGEAAVTRLGPRPVAALGMVLLGGGSLLLAQVPVDGSYPRDLLPGLLIFGLGLGSTGVAAAAAALRDVAERESGVASGINAAAFQIGGALGVAICSTVAVSRGAAGLAGLTAGYRAGFAACVVFAALGLLAALTLLRRR